MRVCIGECARLDFEPVVPVSPPNAFNRIAAQGERPWFPLPDDVPVLMEHEPRIVEKLGSASPQIDSPPARGRNGGAMQSNEPGMLENPDVLNGRLEQSLERGADGRWQRHCTPE